MTRNAIMIAAVLAAATAAPARADPAVQELIDAMRAQEAAKTAGPASVQPTGEARSASFTFSVKIAIRSDIPNQALPTCSMNLNHSNATGQFFSESASIVSERAKNTATCIATIPFSWADADPTRPVSASVSIFWAGTPTKGGLTSRQSFRSSVQVALPKQGGNAKLTFDYTL